MTFIRAELIGSTKAEAFGIITQGNVPLLMLCRQLIAAGHDPKSRLEAYRGKVL